MGKVLVCGSIAYDHIMDFPGLFKDCILPDKIHALNVSFLVNSLKKLRGGTAPNISYNLALIGEKPVIIGTAGKDFVEYSQWLTGNGIDTSLVRILEDDFTASCFITTDLSNNQITGFYPGAMAKDPEISLEALKVKDVSMVVIAPTEPSAMIKWAVECQKLGLPYLFDPGMQIPRLSCQDLITGILGAKIAIFNEYEYEMMIEKSGLTRERILDNVELLVETLGERGSALSTRTKSVNIRSSIPPGPETPTGRDF
jgi:adenosine kinase